MHNGTHAQTHDTCKAIEHRCGNHTWRFGIECYCNGKNGKHRQEQRNPLHESCEEKCHEIGTPANNTSNQAAPIAVGSDALAAAGAGLYEGGYLQVLRMYLVRPFHQPVSPLLQR